MTANPRPMAPRDDTQKTDQPRFVPRHESLDGLPGRHMTRSMGAHGLALSPEHRLGGRRLPSNRTSSAQSLSAPSDRWGKAVPWRALPAC
jgi:hypothetical protein